MVKSCFFVLFRLTAASAYAVSRSPAIMEAVSRNSIMGMVAFFVATIGSQMYLNCVDIHVL